MVCIYCGHPTRVTNSRAHKRTPGTWRRRQCVHCSAIFTTEESAALESSLRVQQKNGLLEPFWRDKLFLAVHESCRHRKSALTDATALTDTILQRLLTDHPGGLLTNAQIGHTTHAVLTAFDTAAATVFAAYHTTK